MKNRNKQRLNRKRKEERLERRDICGVYDPTPYEAVKNLIKRQTMKSPESPWK